MAPRLGLYARSGSEGDQNTLTPTIIVGIVLAAAVGFGAALWLAVRFLKKRSVQRREGNRQSAFLNVRGVVRDVEKQGLPSIVVAPAVQGTTFSRTQLDASVIMPAKVVLRPDATREEIIDHHSGQGNLPRPFAPFSFAMSAPRQHLEPNGKVSRPASIASFASSFRSSFLSSRPVSTISSTSSLEQNKRSVRQTFNPVLPDELVISIGERVAVVQSYDDGWCIVGRDSIFKPGEVELGAVPAWCFVKPVKGLKAERPMRSSSLGVTVNLDAPSAAREEVISWSNF
ncbi:hypothetical protein OBBRIDRAFT_722957 [Obba rivulosa]|uniref:SH3 domain-containing protein n=1 Tax=Obba rivulosa TaxID=1052685 RepID=A0A8E2J6L7_9APHY|nr:hypothetical protein OBBRIDRAFT_722957 [Obba rivulosa]